MSALVSKPSAISWAAPLAGIGITVFAWWLLVAALGADSLMAQRFSPENTFDSVVKLASGHEIWVHSYYSLKRVVLGLLLALGIGIPLGLVFGISRKFANTFSTTFQFLRMVSPLSWMPIAVIALGVGEAPVVFLLTFAAVWPIILNVSTGVHAIDPQWLLLADSVGANRLERLMHIIAPAIATHLLTGVRLSIGLIWIVLVPAEMLGVSDGLGYFVLDTRDRMEYGELMATIIFIGTLGFILDWSARYLHKRWIGS